jgi:uncharacterized membrane protein YbhN (UPF0104 family)
VPNDPEDEPAARPIRVRVAVLQAAVVAVLLAGVGFVLAGIVPGSGARLSHPAIGWIAVEVLLELVACGSYALLFHAVFSHRAFRVPFSRSAEIALGELGAFVVVPTGAGGPAVRFWALLRGGMPWRIVVIRSVVHTVVFNLPYIAAAVALGGAVALGLGPGHASLAVALAPLGVVLVTIAIVAGAAWCARAQRGEPRSRWQRIGREALLAIPVGIRELPARVREPRLLVGAVGYWAGDCGVLVVAFHAAHGSAPVGVVVLAYMLGQLGNTLPLPGGVGGVEPIMLGVMTASGVNLGLGAAAVVLYRFVSLGIQALGGTIAVVALAAALRPRQSVS